MYRACGVNCVLYAPPPLMRLAYLSKLSHDLAPYRLSAPAVWFLPTSRCSVSWASGVQAVDVLRSHRLGSASEYDPRLRAPSCNGSHEVSRPLSATQPSRSTTPGSSPARVKLRPRAYHAPRRFAPSTASLVYFQRGALAGFALQSLTWPQSRRLSAFHSPRWSRWPRRHLCSMA